MSTFTELDPELALKLVEGYEDVLKPEADKLNELYDGFKCIRGCGELQKEYDIKHTFSDPNTMVPRALLRCPCCRYLVDPHSRVTLEVGDPARAAEARQKDSPNVPNNVQNVGDESG